MAAEAPRFAPLTFPLCVRVIALAFRRKAIPIYLAYTWTEIKWITD